MYEQKSNTTCKVYPFNVKKVLSHLKANLSVTIGRWGWDCCFIMKILKTDCWKKETNINGN